MATVRGPRIGNNVPLTPIVQPTQQIKAVPDAEGWYVIKCVYDAANFTPLQGQQPPEILHTLIGWGRTGKVIFRVGPEPNPYETLGDLKGGKESDHLVVRFDMRRDEKVEFSFATQDTPNLWLKVSTEFSSIVDALAYDEFKAFPRLGRKYDAEFWAYGDIRNGKQKFSSLVVGATDYAPNNWVQQDAVFFPGPNQKATQKVNDPLTSGVLVAGDWQTADGTQGHLTLKVLDSMHSMRDNRDWDDWPVL